MATLTRPILDASRTEDSVTTYTSDETNTTNETTTTAVATTTSAVPPARAGARPQATSWTSPAHNEQRKTVIKAILRLLLERRPYADAVWRERIARMAKKLEARLYFTSASLEEHLDMATLRSRLQRVATEVIAARRPAGPNPMVSQEDIAETENLLATFVPTTTTNATGANVPVNAFGAPNVTTAVGSGGSVGQAAAANTRRPYDPTRTTVRRFVLYRTANAA